MRFAALVLIAMLLSGCADTFLRHPVTQEIVRCDTDDVPLLFGGQGVAAFAAIPLLIAKGAVRASCTSKWEARGYVVQDRCKTETVEPGCVTKAERDWTR